MDIEYDFEISYLFLYWIEFNSDDEFIFGRYFF